MANSRTKVVTFQADFQAAAARALETCYLVARAAYGPRAGVVWIENTYGDPQVSRDGVTNLDNLYLKDPVENMIARGAIQASKRSNREVGDGTTATIILAYYLYREAAELVDGGESAMFVQDKLQAIARDVEEYIDKLKIDATPEMLAQVAAISCGDAALGSLIADTLQQVGPQSGVTIQDSLNDSIYPEIVEGFYWPKGYSSPQLINDTAKLEARYNNVAIVVSEKRLSTFSDIGPILDRVSGAGINELIIVGEVEQDALMALAAVRLQGLTVTPVDVPAFAGHRSLMLDDLALVTGAKVLLPGMSSNDWDNSMLGAAEKVVITGSSTSIIGREGNPDAIQGRIQELEQNFNDSTNAYDKEQIQTRLGRLRGKMAILYVGGASEVEQQEVKLRVQDAVCAVQAASRDGVVPGGGVALANAPTILKSHECFEGPLKELALNGGWDESEMLLEISQSSPWKGFDMKTGDFVDLKKAGILDPAPVVKESVKNAVSVVSKIITGTAGFTYADRDAIRG